MITKQGDQYKPIFTQGRQCEYAVYPYICPVSDCKECIIKQEAMAKREGLDGRENEEKHAPLLSDSKSRKG